MVEIYSFGYWVLRQRKALDLTRAELARRVGCASETIKKIERDERRPSQQIAELLANALAVPTEEQTLFLQVARGKRPVNRLPLISESATFLRKRLHNLPAPITSFIGREKEQQEVIDLIAKHRLVTLTGAGGIGKTRLSLQVGNRLLNDYSHGIWFVELVSILDPLLVPRTTAIAIGLRDEPQRPMIDMLCDYLRDKNMLIILDNCEHLIDACGSMADRLLRVAANVRILASSREALGISGEVNYRAPSLELPDVEHLPPVESLSQYEAITLFVERARSAVPNFVMTSENASMLAQICYRLDGIPLAIELVAAKVRILSLQQIAKRLDDRLHWLTSGNRVTLERHQTLRATIDWSYNLLSSPEQILFRRVSVFVGGWTLEAAESLCADEMTRSNDVLNLLEQLINKSLVITDVSQGEARYHMLETVRQYSYEKLIEAGESDTLRDKHLEYFLDFAETADPHLRRTEQIEWLKRLDAEIENLRAALAWAIGKASATSALKLTGSLGEFWNLSLYWLEGAQWLDQALNKEWNKKNETEKAARAKALYRRAGIAGEIDDLDMMHTTSESALVLCEEVQDAWGAAFSRSLIANCQRRLGMPGASIKATTDKCLNEFRRLGDAWGESSILALQAIMLLDSGPRAEYIEIMERCFTRACDSGDRYQMAYSLVVLATDALNHSEWDQAERLMQEAEKLYGEITSLEVGTSFIRFLRTQILFGQGNLEEAKAEAKLLIEYCERIAERNLQSRALSIRALIAEAENDFPGAVVYAQRALVLKREMGVAAEIAFGLMLVGIFEYQQGNVEGARQYVRDSLEFAQRGEVGTRTLINIFVYLGGLFVEKRAHVTIRILALTESLAQAFPVHRDPIFDKPYFERFVSTVRAKLSESEFRSVWDAGSKMTLDEAIELALKTLEESDTL